MTEACKRFAEMAATGNYDYASSGEVRANRLAAVVLEYAGGLDDGSFEGLIDFIRFARLNEHAAYNLVNPS